MLDQEDLKWIAGTSTELNSMLQQITRYSDLAREHKGEYKYVEMLGERAELASKTAQALVERVTSTIPDAAAAPVSEAHIDGSPEFRLLNPQGKRELILFVDDDPEISKTASQMLTTEGYKVILAKDGFEALKIYGDRGNQIGLVILDFFLPVMDGDAVFDELRELNPNVNAVLSSGFAEQGKISAMLAQGLRGFIPKPYTREKLLAQVRSTLDARHHPTR